MSDNYQPCAPLLVTVYTRVEHFKQTIAALKNNYLSDHTELFIASDAGVTACHQSQVDAVRTYVKKITGFKSVTLIARQRNVGVLENYCDSVNFLLCKYERLIFLQDDVIVGKGFLKFMNDGLIRYENEPRVIGVCGYIPPCADGKRGQPFFLSRRSPYGIGMWKEKENRLDAMIGPQLAAAYLSSWDIFMMAAKHSPHITRALPFIAKGDFRAGDFEAALAMRLNGLLALYPPNSLVRNIGLDGSGLHSGINKELQLQVCSDAICEIPPTLELTDDCQVNRQITAYWSYPGHWIVSSLIFFGYNFVPGFYWLLSKLKKFKRGFLARYQYPK